MNIRQNSLKIRSIIRDKDGFFIMAQRVVHPEAITILNVCVTFIKLEHPNIAENRLK